MRVKAARKSSNYGRRDDADITGKSPLSRPAAIAGALCMLPHSQLTELLSQTEQRGVRAVGKTVSNRQRRIVMTETRRHKWHRRKASDDGADSLACSILRKDRARMTLARGILYKGAVRICRGYL
jgi:hypothetical protein